MIKYKTLINILLEDNRDKLINDYNLKGGINAEHDDFAEHKDTNSIVDHFLQHGHPEGHQRYLPWIIKQYHEGKIRQEDASDIKEKLQLFDKFKNNRNFTGDKDINKHSIQSLSDAVEPHRGTVASKREEKHGDLRDAKIEGADKVFEKNGVTVHHVKTHEAACVLGAGMGLCTGQRTADSNNYFKRYTEGSDDPDASEEERNSRKITIVHARDPKTKKIERYQFHPATGQFHGKSNSEINVSELVKANPELREAEILKGQHPAFADDKEFEEGKKSKFLKSREMIQATYHDPRIKQADLHEAMMYGGSQRAKSAASSPYLSKEGHQEALEDKDNNVVLGAVENKKTKGEQLSNALTHSNLDVRLAATRHENAEPHHIDYALKDELLAEDAIKNPRAKHRLHQILTSNPLSKHESGISSESMILSALENPEITPELLDAALNAHKDGNSINILKKIVSHPKAEIRHIDAGLNHSHSSVREAAIKNRRASLEQIEKILFNSRNFTLKSAALENPKIKPSHISYILNNPDEDPFVKEDAFNHYHFSSLPEEEKKEHLKKAINSDNTQLHSAVLKSPDLKLLSDEDRTALIRKMTKKISSSIFDQVINHEDIDKLTKEEKQALLTNILGGEGSYSSRHRIRTVVNSKLFNDLPEEEKTHHINNILKNDPSGLSGGYEAFAHPNFKNLSDEDKSEHVNNLMKQNGLKYEVITDPNFDSLPDAEKTKHTLNFLTDPDVAEHKKYYIFKDYDHHFNKLGRDIQIKYLEKYLTDNPPSDSNSWFRNALEDKLKELKGNS